MRTGSRERYTASPVSVFQMVSAMTAATRRDCAGKHAAPSSRGNGDAAFGGNGGVARAIFVSQRAPQPLAGAVPAKARHLVALLLGCPGITDYH